MNNRFQKIIKYILGISAFAILYHLAARLGLQMAYVQPNTSPVWPPTGISIAVLLIFGLSYWPGVTLGVLGGSILTGAPTGLAAGMALGNTLEAFLAAFILTRKLNFHPSLDRLNDVTEYAIVSLFSTFISAIIGTLTLGLTNQLPSNAFYNVLVTWWIGDLLGALVVGSTILVWLKSPPIKKYKKNLLEGFGLVLLIILTSWYVFSKQPPIDVIHQAMIYVIFPFVIWSALRFGQHGAVTGIFLISTIAIWGTIHGYGPFVQASINESLIVLQTFMGVVSLTSLILGATIIERRQATLSLQQRIEDLDTLNNASKFFLSNSDKASIYQIICKIAVEKINARCAWIDIPTAHNESIQPAAAVGITPDKIAEQKTAWENKTRKAKKITGESNLSQMSYGNFPLVFGNTTLGMLNVIFRDASIYTNAKRLLIQSYANLAAVAIQNTLLFDEVSRGNEQLHALSQRLMKAQEEERLHLSRELHDESGQILSALMVEMGLMAKIPQNTGEQHSHIEKIQTLSMNLQENLHRLAANLRPASLDHLGLVKSIEQYAADFSNRHSIPVDFEAVGLEDKRLPTDIETSLFRIVQESLTNVALHARASRVDILISFRNHHVIAVIEDDGIGFTTTNPIIEKQLGLFGMKERVEMLNGLFTLESSPGKGTIVKVEVPVVN